MNNYETNRSTIHQAILTVVTILPSSFSSLSLLLAVFLLVDFSQLKPSLPEKIHNRFRIHLYYTQVSFRILARFIFPITYLSLLQKADVWSEA